MASRTLTVVIAGDASGAKTAFGQVDDGASSLDTKLKNVGQSMMSFGTKMTLGATLPLALLGKASFDAASDLNESLSKVGVAFDTSAGDIRRWSQTAAESMGISRQEALEAAGTFGNLFRAMGIGIPTSAEMSKKIVGLASDLASFNNADPSEVLEALRSGLVGETEPLRKFGVSLSAARIEAKAMEMGLADANGELSAGAKAQAAYQIILEDTTLAQGDFARTADGAANKQRILSARFDDAKAKLGQALLPIFQQVASAVEKIATAFTNLDPKWQKLIVFAGLAVAAIGPLSTVLGGLLTVIGAISLPVLAVALAIGVLIAAAVLLYTKWDEIWNWIKDHPAIAIIIASVLAPLILIVGSVVVAIKLVKEHWDVIWPAIQSVAESVWGVLQVVFGALDTAIRAIATAAEWLWERWQEAWPTIQAILEGAWGVMQVVFGALSGAVETVMSVIGTLRDIWGEAWPVIQSAINVAWTAISPWLDAMKLAIDGIVGVVTWLKDNAGTAWSAFTSAVETMWSIAQVPLNALKAVLETIVTNAKRVKDAIDSIPTLGIGGEGLDPKRYPVLNRGKASGGIIPGMAGTPYPVTAHGGEVVLNSGQQARLLWELASGRGGGQQGSGSLDRAADALVAAAHALLGAAAAQNGTMSRSEMQRLARAS